MTQAKNQPATRTAARALAGALGVFIAFNLLGARPGVGFDLNNWWISFAGLPRLVAVGYLLAALLALGWWAARPKASRWRRRATCTLVLGLALVAMVNAVDVLRLLNRGYIRSGAPLPLSLLVAAALGWLAYAIGRGAQTGRWGWKQCGAFAVTLGVCAMGFPLAQMALFGQTDYRRPADAIVVFGARAYADGRLSTALGDRVATAVDLYHQGYAPLLIFSGGPGDGDIDEPTAMMRYAVAHGVPAEAIVLDPMGLNTAATVEQSVGLFKQHNVRHALAVSHFYHLPRIKLAYERAGLTVYTVPAEQRRTLVRLPHYMLREVAAWWAYYGRAAVG